MATRQQILANISKQLAAIKAKAKAIAKEVAKKVAAKKAVITKPIAEKSIVTKPIVTKISPTPTAYTGPSIVDYLKSAGQPSDFASREKLAAQQGITDYRGTAEQNIRLLGLLKTKAPPVTAPEKEPKEGEIKIIGGKEMVYRPWGKWTPVPTPEEITKYPKPPALTEEEKAKEIEEIKEKIKEKKEESKKVLEEVIKKGVEIPGARELAKIVGVELPEFPETEIPKTGDYAKGLLGEYEKKKSEYEKRMQEQLDAITKEREAAEKEIKNIRTTQAGLLEKDIEPLLRPWREDLEKSERKRLSVEKNYFDNQKSVEELNKLLTQMRDEVAAAEEVTGLRAIREPRIQKLKEDLKGRIGIIEAVMAARNQQINMAYSLIDRMANTIEADRKNRVAYYEGVYKFYQTARDEEGKKVFELTKEERDWTEAQIKLVKDDMDTAKGTVDYLKSLMLDSQTANLIEKAGIKLTDSLEEINVKLADATYQEDIISTIDNMALKGYKYLPLESQWRIKPEEELIKIYDSRKKEMVFWGEKKEEPITKKPEELYPETVGIEANTAGVQALANKGWNFGDIFIWLTEMKRLAIGTAERLLQNAGIFSAADKASASGDLMESIEKYKINWAAIGDEAGTREEFAQKAKEYFPEFSEQEILNYVYQNVTDEWLAENRKQKEKTEFEEAGGYIRWPWKYFK